MKEPNNFQLGTNPKSVSSLIPSVNPKHDFTFTESTSGNSFEPLAFKSTRNNRLNFDKLNDHELTLNSITDNLDLLTGVGETESRLNPVKINRQWIDKRVHEILGKFMTTADNGQANVPSKKRLSFEGDDHDLGDLSVRRVKQVKLDYYGEDKDSHEGDDRGVIFMNKNKNTSIKFKRRTNQLKPTSDLTTTTNIGNGNESLNRYFVKSLKVCKFKVSCSSSSIAINDQQQQGYINFTLTPNNVQSNLDAALPVSALYSPIASMEAKQSSIVSSSTNQQQTNNQPMTLTKQDYHKALKNLSFIKMPCTSFSSSFSKMNLYFHIVSKIHSPELNTARTKQDVDDDDDDDDGDQYDEAIRGFLVSSKIDKFVDADDGDNELDEDTNPVTDVGDWRRWRSEYLIDVPPNVLKLLG